MSLLFFFPIIPSTVPSPLSTHTHHPSPPCLYRLPAISQFIHISHYSLCGTLLCLLMYDFAAVLGFAIVSFYPQFVIRFAFSLTVSVIILSPFPVVPITLFPLFYLFSVICKCFSLLTSKLPFITVFHCLLWAFFPCRLVISALFVCVFLHSLPFILSFIFTAVFITFRQYITDHKTVRFTLPSFHLLSPPPLSSSKNNGLHISERRCSADIGNFFSPSRQVIHHRNKLCSSS